MLKKSTLQFAPKRPKTSVTSPRHIGAAVRSGGLRLIPTTTLGKALRPLN